MNYCPHCHSPLKENASFCPHCGSDKETGWSEGSEFTDLETPDYEEIVDNEFGSKKKVALKYYEDYHWINYIAGLAIIADEQNNLRYIPVKGAESGVIDYLAIYMAEHKVK